MEQKFKDTYVYPAVINYEDEQYSVIFPDLPGCASCVDKGEPLEKIMLFAREVLSLTLWGMEDDNDPIPPPSNLKDIELKNNEFIYVVEIFMPPIRDYLENQVVSKTVTLPNWLNIKVKESEFNCSKLLTNTLIEELGLDGGKNEN